MQKAALSIALMGTCLLALPCVQVGEAREPWMTAVEESLSEEELMHRARQFHGHLGAWLVLGLRAGEYGVKRLEAEKWFGLRVLVECQTRPPERCLVDGLQLSTGCTYGKGNIELQPLPEGAHYAARLILTRNDGRSLVLTVPPQVRQIFEEWNRTLTEEQVFAAVLGAPSDTLFTVETENPPLP